MKRIVLNILVAMVFLVPHCSLSVAGEVLHCEAIKVIDGDSILIRVGGAKKEVRLWGIDSPEYDQPYAAAAKKCTASLLTDSLKIKVIGRDGYNRILGMVYSGDICINRELVRQGAAWVYDYYCRSAECREWAGLERKARVQKRGLWRDDDPIPPWKWRKSRK